MHDDFDVRHGEMRFTSRLTLAGGLVALSLLMTGVESCSPGRGYGSRQRPRKMTPLVFKQHIPNVAEDMLGASGPAEGRIQKGDEKFKGLVRFNSDDILFKNDEGNGDDRMMTLRCRDKLLALSVSVMNQWPGVRVRVIEGWDSDGHHPSESLHYEGRAVDITTSDKDRTKYGILARLAVDVGFDWVYYESRGHVHCSVKSDSSIATKFDGCFSGVSQVKVEGRDTALPIRDLQIGDRVLSLDVATGSLLYDDVIAFLHRSGEESATFHRLEAENDVTIDVTPSHLLFSAATEEAGLTSAEAGPVSDVTEGRYLFVATGNASSVRAVKVHHVRVMRDVGVYAPLTRTGTIVVDGVIASCYALFRSHDVAHVAMAPLRLAYYVTGLVGSRDVREMTSSSSVHWYAELLLRVTQSLVPAMFHGQQCEVYDKQ